PEPGADLEQGVARCQADDLVDPGIVGEQRSVAPARQQGDAYLRVPRPDGPEQRRREQDVTERAEPDRQDVRGDDDQGHPGKCTKRREPGPARHARPDRGQVLGPARCAPLPLRLPFAMTRPRSILWVDDEVESLTSHILFLQEQGFTVETATHGDDAIVLLQRQNYGVVLLDEQMPGRRGLEL